MKTALLAFAVVIASAPAFAADLTVKIEGLKNDKGHVEISVFSDNGAYYKDTDHAAAHLRLTVAEAKNFKVPRLNPGKFAIAIFHDANDNGKLDTMLGIPKEGYSFSNSNGIMPPKWDKASFDVPSAGTTVTLKMRYL